MKKLALLLIFVVVVVMALLSCVGVSVAVKTPSTQVEVNAGNTGNSGSQATGASAVSVQEIDDYITKAREAIDANHLQEAVKLYISALIRANKANNKAKVDEITNALNELGAKFTLELSNTWKASNDKAINGNSFWAAQAKGIMPSLYLYQNFGFGKSPLQDVAVRFDFIENNGTLTPTVFTDLNGFAATTIVGIQDPRRSVRIRAYPVFTNEGYSFAYKSVYQDFVYIPVPFTVLVYTMEKAAGKTSEYARNMENLSNILKSVPLQPSIVQESLKPDVFMNVLQGDISKLPSAKTANYDLVALFYIEISEPVQTILNGKAYNIFNCVGTVTVRIVSYEGAVMYSLVLDRIQGSGSGVQSAIDNCRNQIGQALEEAMAKEQQKLYSAVYK